jgi:Transposase DDE domain
MSQKRQKPWGNPDFRHRTQMPAPAIEQIEQELLYLLSPATFKPLGDSKGKILRNRLLTLPVMMAIVVSLVYRQIPSLSEVTRVLEKEGLLWVESLKVSKQALSKRLASLPADLFAELFEQVIQKLSRRKPLYLPSGWQPVYEKFTALWIADGSTLEALRKKLKVLQEESSPLGGKMMMIVEAFTHSPVRCWYSEESAANDKIWNNNLLAALPVGGLLIFDLGFFSFVLFDAFSEEKKFFVTRLRQKTAYKVTRTLTQGNLYKDELIELGKYRSNPCKHPVRLVTVLWGKTWYYYLTNVLDPELLSAQQVCELYRRRWRVEDAFLLTKRLLGLSYLWVGGQNGVQIQIFATWIFYAVLNNLCAEVAGALNQPLERISVEMVFRGLYHFSRALLRGESEDVVAFLAENYKLLGLVKAVRKRHRDSAALSQEIWASSG